MLLVGVVLVLTLSFVPYSLTILANWQHRITSAVVSSGEPQIPPPQQKQAPEPAFDAATWYAARGEAPETHGVLIETLDGGRALASHNADEIFNPASLIKLATSLAALKKLGADYRFQTRVYVDGTIDTAGTLRGRLYVSGHDPTFGDAGAALIAKELRALGVKRLGEDLYVSPDFSFNFSESPDESAKRLSNALHLGSLKTSVAEEPAGKHVLTLYSHPLRDVLLYMNARSSNFIAERLGAMVGGPQGIQQFLVEELKLAPEKVTIERASGREHNRLTPRELVAVIRALVEEEKRQGLEPADIMPVASDDAGTLRRRLAGTRLEGAVVGKTGTLTSEVDGGMASLAGLVYTRDLGPIVFAILDQGSRIGDNRQLEDQLLAEVIGGQSTPLPVGSPTPRQYLPSAGLRVERENVEGVRQGVIDSTEKSNH